MTFGLQSVKILQTYLYAFTKSFKISSIWLLALLNCVGELKKIVCCPPIVRQSSVGSISFKTNCSNYFHVLLVSCGTQYARKVLYFWTKKMQLPFFHEYFFFYLRKHGAVWERKFQKAAPLTISHTFCSKRIYPDIRLSVRPSVKPVSQNPSRRLMPNLGKRYLFTICPDLFFYLPYFQTIFDFFTIFFFVSLTWDHMGEKNSNDICSEST